MLTVIVKLHVRPGKVDDFLEAIHENAISTLNAEPGCLRFDVHRSTEDPNSFVLYEIYRDAAAFYDEHRTTDHYSKWRAAAADLVVEGSHVNTFCEPVFPADIPEASRA
jgi:(4S)-4-hydroxy-5-phosphonooxypentane-2,3-dione isomerase